MVGAGLVGLATAHAITIARPGARVTVIDKEAVVAAHQSGRNSGVIHSGVYYPPGSAKATMCREGRDLLLAFCRRHGIAHELCGKVVVATDATQRPALHEIARRGAANGVSAGLIGRARLQQLEPAVRGVEALHVHDAGIVDFPAVARRLADLVAEAGGEVRLGHAVTAAQETTSQVVVRTGVQEVAADVIVTCAGLQSDRLLWQLTGVRPPVSIVPFRGEYHQLRPEARHLCRGLIYPVPDPRFPFLGVHLTRHISGAVLAGPNAVLAGSREGYAWSDWSWRELGAVARTPGMSHLAARHWATGAGEVWRSRSRAAFTRRLQQMTPDIRIADLEPARAGVRAQALRPDGSLADDFVVHTTARGVHVLNAPSPAATASLSIGRTLAERALALL